MFNERHTGVCELLPPAKQHDKNNNKMDIVDLVASSIKMCINSKILNVSQRVNTPQHNVKCQLHNHRATCSRQFYTKGTKAGQVRRFDIDVLRERTSPGREQQE